MKTDRQSDKQTDRQRDGRTGIQIYKYVYRLRDIQTSTQASRHKGRKADKRQGRQTDKQSVRQKER